MPNGVVKWFNVAKGYGYIRPTDATIDVFVDRAACQDARIDSLQPGQPVSYDVVIRGAKPAAMNLKPV